MSGIFDDKHTSASSSSKKSAEGVTARFYLCLRCRNQVAICRNCDRGNIYCIVCAPLARPEARRAASKRYQESSQGRRNHALRQKRYRERLASEKEKVTHQGSNSDEKMVEKKVADLRDETPQNAECMPYFETLSCGICSCISSSFLRHGFLTARQYDRVRTQKKQIPQRI